MFSIRQDPQVENGCSMGASSSCEDLLGKKRGPGVESSNNLALGQRLKEALWKCCVYVASGIAVRVVTSSVCRLAITRVRVKARWVLSPALSRPMKNDKLRVKVVASSAIKKKKKRGVGTSSLVLES